MAASFAPGPEIEPPEIPESLAIEDTAPDPYPLEDGSWAMTLEEIGEELRISKERVRSIQDNALAKIRRSRNAKTLIEFLESHQPKVRASRQDPIETHCTPEKRKPQYVVLVPDPFTLSKIVDSLQRQLAANDLHTQFVGPHLVQNKWAVLEFIITNGTGGRVHIVLNGSGPGRAAWTLTADSAEHAVTQITGRLAVGRP
jgi:hypothetical protein